jgi:epsilon-lactone hydrolase
MTLLSLRDSGFLLPKPSFFLSLMGGDLSDFDAQSNENRKVLYPLNSKEIVKKYCDLYMSSNSIEPPIKQCLKGLPEMFIQVGDDEVLLSESK